MREFDGLPDHSAVWIYASDRVLTDDDQTHIRGKLSKFLQNWTSHGRVVVGRVTIAANRFVILAAYVPEGDVSGCGIDAAMRVLNDVAQERKFNWLSPLTVYYVDEYDEIKAVERQVFRELARNGDVDGHTTVVDTSIKALGELRSDGLMRPAGRSWHARVFKLEQPAGV